MGKTFKDRKDVSRNYKEISKLKKKYKNQKVRKEDYDDGRRQKSIFIK